jgi:uncharacterized protein (TIGR04255 family)
LLFRDAKDFAKLEKASKKLIQDYPLSDPVVEQQVQFENSDQRLPRFHYRSEPVGFQLTSLDQANIVSLNKDRLATSRAAPYEGWNRLRAQAEKNWRSVIKSLGVTPISRIGVRYVNRLDIPLKGSTTVNLDEYLHFVPKIDSFSAHPMTEFVYLVTRSTELENWSARLVTSLVPPPLIDHISLGFDIDVFRTDAIPIDNAQLWSIVDEARSVKNSIFEMYITDRARELFNA